MYKFQDCEFEIGKPICVLCFGYKTRGSNSEPDSWFPVSSKKDLVGNAALKVKRSYVSELVFSPKDHTKAVRILLENGNCLRSGETYYIGHSVREVMKKWEDSAL